jgi:putative ABC transport system ATP-binding protein
MLTPQAAPEPAVRVRGLGHSFGAGENSKPVLCGIDMAVPPGQTVILTGPSGSGKTTLLTVIGALRSVQQGSARVLGQELAGLAGAELTRVRREIGFVFQTHNLFGALTALQNVRLTLELEGGPRRVLDERAADMLRQVGLGDRLHDRPDALSGGQRQRVAVARALVHNPRLVLADEPTAALDKESSHDMVELFRRLTRERGSAILLVTHDPRICEVADRVVRLVDGRIEEDRGVG